MAPYPSTSPPYILAISSFAVHGTASLKTFTTVLGSSILPVPSLILNGLTNMQRVKKLEIPFHDLLESSLDLVQHRNLKVLLYIGYLGNAGQVDSVLELISRYRAFLDHIILDPISGDHDKAYIAQELILRLPELIQIAHITFPNFTEIKLLAGFDPGGNENIDFYLHQYKQLTQYKPFVVTSLPFSNQEIGLAYFDGKNMQYYSHPKLNNNFGGTGDAFLAYFILYHYYKGLDFFDSLKSAADKTLKIMEMTLNMGREDLYI